MIHKFIYVFSKEISDSLKEKGFNTVMQDKNNGIYIFENNPEIHHGLVKDSFVYSNTLVFGNNTKTSVTESRC